MPLPHTGLNPYKMVEMFAKYRPVVPVEFQSDELYAEPSKEVYSKVKTKKNRSIGVSGKAKSNEV